MSQWAERASALYDRDYARRYRAHDEDFDGGGPYGRLVGWLQGICQRFDPPIDVLDLGCGTGRYFWALSGVRNLVGMDASAAMLAEAERPRHADRISAKSIALVNGDLFGHEFEPAQFDLIYAVGVLAEHAPLDERIVSRVVRWLKPLGRFAFTTVHPDSPSIPVSAGRWLGRLLRPVAPPPVRAMIHDRLLAGGLYADESRVRQLLTPAFDIESLEPFQSEAHLHCLCVARKKRA